MGVFSGREPIWFGGFFFKINWLTLEPFCIVATLLSLIYTFGFFTFNT